MQQQLFTSFPDAKQHTSNARLTARSGSFADNVRLPIHRWFRYSAGFSAEWAAFEIEQRVGRNGRVLDPFVGSGTTLLAADSLSVASVGLESHPFIARVARAKLLWDLDPCELFLAAERILVSASTRGNRRVDENPKLITDCYVPDVLERLDSLKWAYQKHADSANPIWELVWLALTSILRPCSHVGTAQWQYILPNKRKAVHAEPYSAFKESVALMVADMRTAIARGFIQLGTVRTADARQATVEGDLFNFVLTSPPYPNNFDYADSTRLEMTFWGEIQSWGDLQQHVRQFIIRSCSQHSAAERLQLDQLLEREEISPIEKELRSVCERLAEVRKHKGGKKTYHTMVAAYFVDLAQVWRNLRTLCAPGADICFVVGDSAPYGVHVPVEQWLGSLAIASGFHDPRFEKLRDRNIKWKNRKHTVPLHEGRLWLKG